MVRESWGAEVLPVLHFGNIVLIHAQRLLPQLVQIDIVRSHIAIYVIERVFPEVSLLPLILLAPKREGIDRYLRALRMKCSSTFDFKVLVLII